MLELGKIDYGQVFKRYDILVESKVSPEELFEELAPEEEVWRNIAEDVAFMKEDEVEEDVKSALEKYDPEEVINNGLIAGMDVVSELYGRGIYYLPQVILASDAMSLGIELCEAKMKETGEEREMKGTVVMHVAEGDPHDIGKDIAAAMLKAKGYNVIDLGRDVPVEDVVECAIEEDADLVTGTALMTTTQTAFPKIAERLQEEGVNVAFIGAGGAVNPAFVHSYPLGIYADEAADGPAISGAVVDKKLSWEEIRDQYDELVPSAVGR
ncbi:methanol:corrinoid methyltransferase [candidate division MSBL1 archaeon SCGC-AAA382C18]|uniref:Methanol:corrinoid methyltransferase n=1 Tax=candidate division MSBL1 archaeon SCGC-AAA382C18 TaxID=1698281 RepID=A0A133VJB9_9EURY|nr:methanol:corrinoid methyltransferase [candidate division MSBL1 archaeon SCGC-AAA382C18]